MWHGWRWERDRWRRICEGRSLGDAHRRLNKLLPPGLPNLHAALTGTGVAPTWKPPTRETHR